jgi:hypothetical protein
MNPITIQSVDGVQFQIVDGRLLETGNNLNRNTSIAAIGKILRGYKSTKTRTAYVNTKNVRVYYAKGIGFAYSVPVNPNGTSNLSIGCVQFAGKNAQTLRRQALKSSKVLA